MTTHTLTTKEEFWNLRQDVVLNSLFIGDYQNRFHFNPSEVCEFIDSYAGYLAYLMDEQEADYNGNQYFSLLSKYDTPDNLWNWVSCFEEPNFTADEYTLADDERFDQWKEKADYDRY